MKRRTLKKVMGYMDRDRITELQAIISNGIPPLREAMAELYENDLRRPELRKDIPEIVNLMKALRAYQQKHCGGY